MLFFLFKLQRYKKFFRLLALDIRLWSFGLKYRCVDSKKRHPPTIMWTDANNLTE